MSFSIETVKENVQKHCSRLSGVAISEKAGGTAEASDNGITCNLDYMKTLTPEEQAFVIAHEQLHIEWGHVFGSESGYENRDVLDWILDAKINAKLMMSGMKCPKKAFLPGNIAGKWKVPFWEVPTKVIYNYLTGKEEKKEDKHKEKEQGLLDNHDHDKWIEAGKKRDAEKQKDGFKKTKTDITTQPPLERNK